MSAFLETERFSSALINICGKIFPQLVCYAASPMGFEERVYPTRPIVGVGAVVFNATKVLLVRRAFEPGLGLWSIPGGLVELG
ncbi:MAG: NUDIX domain-containing protein, partial [Candidatus Bathyarchaeia archaeon]